MKLSRRKWMFGSVLAIGFTAAGIALAQAPADAPARNDREQLPQPLYRTAHKAESSDVGLGSEPAEHPLAPALRMAKSCYEHINKDIGDYSCRMVKRERIGGKLNEQEFMFVKIRHQPFSVYTYFLGPEKKKGQEAIYVAGRNDGKLLAHGVGVQKLIGTVRLDPTGSMAMKDNRYPITEIGFLNLTKRLIEVAEKDSQYGECDVKIFKNAKINQRSCTCIQVVHPVPRKNFLFNMARVFLDDELNVPVRYEAYDWPAVAGEAPQLIEEYTYLDIKINNGFTDLDFDEKNPSYNF